MELLVVVAIALVCPLTMGALMVWMMRGMRGHRRNGDGE